MFCVGGADPAGCDAVIVDCCFEGLGFRVGEGCFVVHACCYRIDEGKECDDCFLHFGLVGYFL